MENENKNKIQSIEKKDIIYVMPAHQPAEEIDLIELFKVVWDAKYILITSIVLFAVIGGLLIVAKKDGPGQFQGTAVIKVGEYLVNGGVQQVIDTEELLYRIGYLKPVNTVLNRKIQATGLIKVSVVGNKNFVKKTGDQTVANVMEYLSKREKMLSEYWVALISPSQVLWPLKISQIKQKNRNVLLFSSMIIIGLVVGLLIIFIRQSFRLKIK